MPSRDVAAILTRMVICAIVFDAFIPLSPFIVEDLNIAQASFKSTLTLGMCTLALFQLLSAPLISRVGAHLSLSLASVLTGIACIALSLAQGMASLALALLTMFVVNAVAAVSARSLLRNLVDHAHYQKLNAYAFSLINAIGIASPLVLVELAQTLSWRWPLVVLGGSLSIVGIWLFFNRGAKTSEGGLGALKLSDCLYLMRQQDFILPLLIGISVQGVYISMFVNKPFVMLNEFGLSTDSLGIALSLFAALGVVGFFISGRSVQRIGDKGRALIGLFLEASSVALMIGAAAADSFICFILAVAAWTLALGFLLPLSAARAIDVRPTTLTAASASYGFMQTAGAALLAYLSTLSALPAVITLTMLGAGSLLLSSVAVKLSGWA